MSTVPAPVPLPLSGLVPTGSVSGIQLDLDIDGLPFTLHPTEKDPWVWSVTEDRKESVDDSPEAGENSFGYFWLRSQTTWHGGAGQTFSDNGSSEDVLSARSQFLESSNVDVFTTVGQATLGYGTTALNTTNCVRAVAFVRGGVNKIAVARGDSDSLDFYNVDPALAFDTNVSLTEPAATCLDITTDGENLWVVINGKIIKVDGSGVQTDWATLAISNPVRIAYVKNRLIFTHGRDVYDVDTSAAVGPLTTTIFRHPSTNWRWSDITEGPIAIYLAGYVGLTGRVYSLSVTENSSGALVLGTPQIQIQLPTGEIPYAVLVYINSLFVVGTSEGARVGSFDPASGRPTFGPLSYSGSPVRALGALASFAYLGADDGIYRLDLGTPLDRAGRYAHAHYRSPALAAPQSYISVLTSGAVGNAKVYTATSNRLEADGNGSTPGTLTSSWFAFSTTEKKQLYYVVVAARVTTGGNQAMRITIENSQGDTETFDIPENSTQTVWTFGSQLAASDRYRFKATFNAGAGVNLLESVQFKGLSEEQRYDTMVLPLMVADDELTSSGRRTGHPNAGPDRLRALMAKARINSTILITNRVTNETYRAKIRDCRFRQDHGIAAMPGKKIFGMVNLVVRGVS